MALPLVALVTFAVVFGARPVALVEGFLVHVFPTLVAVTGPIFVRVPLASIELIASAIALVALAFLGRRLLRIRRKDETWRAALALTARRTLGLLAVASIVIVLVTSLAIRRPIEERVALDPLRVTAADLVRAAIQLDGAVVEARRAMGTLPALHAVSAGDWLDGKAGDRFPFDRAAIVEASKLAASEAVAILESRSFATFQPPREPWPRWLFHGYGCWGRSNPFVGEVTVSRFISAVDHVAVLPHEYVHAAGILREREACFYAFVGGARSKNPVLRYCVLVDARRGLINAALAAGETNARLEADQALPNDVAFEIQERERLTNDHAFGPGASIEIVAGPAGGPAQLAVTPGEPQGHATMAAYGAVSRAAGMPLDYSSANPIIAAWILAGR